MCVCVCVHRSAPSPRDQSKIKIKNLFQSNKLQELRSRQRIFTHIAVNQKVLATGCSPITKRERVGVGSVTHSENLTHTSPVNGSPVGKGNEVAPIKSRGRRDLERAGGEVLVFPQWLTHPCGAKGLYRVAQAVIDKP